MTEFSSPGNPLRGPHVHQPGTGAPDPARRLLLRAAAATPLLATIPSGAAFANTSAFQCVVTSKEDSDKGLPTLTTLDPLDKWVHARAKYLRFYRASTETYYDGYSMDISGSPDSAKIWYDQNGNLLSPTFGTPCGGAELCPQGTSTFTYVLAIFQPFPDGAAPTSVLAKGFYPQQSTAYNRPSQVGNIGLYVSCYNSVAPTIVSNDRAQQVLMSAYCDV